MKSYQLVMGVAALVLGTSCSESEKSDSEVNADTQDSEVDMSTDTSDIEDGVICSDVGPRIVGCPCTYPNLDPYCCTRATNQMAGWICDSGKWDTYQSLGCDGDPADCRCPLCPIEWEPESWSPPPEFDPP